MSLSSTTFHQNSQKNDELTVVIFKDQLASRSFRLPVRMISRLSLIFSFIMILTVLSLLFVLKILLSPEGGNPAIISKLEEKNTELSNEIQILKEKLAIDEARFSDTTPAEEPQSVEGVLFSAPDLPIQLTDFSSTWENKNGHFLKVNFNLKYIKTDNKSQQGRIIIIGKARDALYTHPKNLFHWNNNVFSINAKNGESFYVSRFRSTEAFLGPFTQEKTIQTVEVYLYNEKAEPIFVQSFNTAGRK